MARNTAARKPQQAAPSKLELPKLYHFRDRPQAILDRLNCFAELGTAIQKKRNRMRFQMLFVAGGLIAALYQLGITTQEFVDVPGAPLMLLGFVFAVFAFNIRTAVMYRRSSGSLPALSAGPIALTLICGFFSIMTIVSFGASDSSDGGLFGSLKSILSTVKHETSLLQSPQPTLIAMALSIAFVWLLFSWLQYRRLGRVNPQPFELFFCKTILQGVLRELPPDARCRVSLNPFPMEWSAISQTKGGSGRATMLDCLLDFRVELGQGRTLSTTVVHRRGVKGQRKFKGYKHKVKVKTVLEREGAPVSTGNVRDRTVQLTQETPLTQNDRWKFIDSVNTRTLSVNVQGSSLIATQSYLNPCTMRSNLTAAELPHPEILLHLFRAMCENALSQPRKAG
ncbi:MAG: hypothetical protein U0136_17685 [Bdellovibrionota bacterium]